MVPLNSSKLGLHLPQTVAWHSSLCITRQAQLFPPSGDLIVKLHTALPIMCCLQHFRLKHEPVIWCQCFDLERQKSQFSLCVCSSPKSRNNLLKGQGDAACRAALLPWEAGRGVVTSKGQTPSFNFCGSQKVSEVTTHSAIPQSRLLGQLHECLHKSSIQKILFFFFFLTSLNLNLQTQFQILVEI